MICALTDPPDRPCASAATLVTAQLLGTRTDKQNKSTEKLLIYFLI